MRISFSRSNGNSVVFRPQYTEPPLGEAVVPQPLNYSKNRSDQAELLAPNLRRLDFGLVAVTLLELPPKQAPSRHQRLVRDELATVGRMQLSCHENVVNAVNGLTTKRRAELGAYGHGAGMYGSGSNRVWTGMWPRQLHI